MNSFVVSVLAALAFLASSVSAQESVNAHEGFEVGKQVGIALAICYTILATFTLTVNCIKKKCVKPGSY